MPAYDICYLEEDGALACAFTVQFESEMRAKILAHAMKPADCHRLEVWHGKALVYCRPEARLDARRPIAQTRPHEPGNVASPA
ncbi:MAG TPA: hypothetical protein VII56_08965 [Rhizomicrobium sp.]